MDVHSLIHQQLTCGPARAGPGLGSQGGAEPGGTPAPALRGVVWGEGRGLG